MTRGVMHGLINYFLNTAIRVHYYVLSRREQTPSTKERYAYTCGGVCGALAQFDYYQHRT